MGWAAHVAPDVIAVVRLFDVDLSPTTCAGKSLRGN